MILLIALQSCSVNKLIPENKFLLKKSSIINAPSEFSYDLGNLMKQNPRRKGFGFSDPFLWTYMKMENKKPTTLNKAIIKVLGEKPVYLDTALLRSSAVQMHDFLLNKGYFRNSVGYHVVFKGKKAKAQYFVSTGEPYIVDNISYAIEDKKIEVALKSYMADQSITGKIYDSERLIAERDLITKTLNNQGFYKFNKYYIFFDVDTTFGINKKVSVKFIIRDLSDTSHHKVYSINNITIDPNYSMIDSIKKDTVYLLSYRFIGTDFDINPTTLLRNIKFKKDDLYCLDKVTQTITLLSELQVFKFIDVDFKEINVPGSDSVILDCYIRLTPMKKLGYSIDSEMNTTEENVTYTGLPSSTNRYLGMAGSITVINRNIFKRAILWSTKIGGGFDVRTNSIANRTFLGNSQADLSSTLYFPFAFVPEPILNKGWFQTSKTALSLSYLYDQNFDYWRKTLNLAYTYQFNRTLGKHFITPFEISRVKTLITNQAFKDKLLQLDDPLLNNFFETHLINDFKYSFAYKDKGIKSKQYWRIFWNVFETGGNLPRLLYVIAEGDRVKSDSTIYTIGGVRFYQYFKSDIDLSFNKSINQVSAFASRFYLGLGLPYGNSDILPFEKRYFIGGPNSVRAWPIRGFGPGSYSDTSFTQFDKTGEIKIETNHELRFNIVSVVKGAIFVDMGNVWTYKKDDSRPGGEFKFNTFLPEIAIGTGFGLRFDFVYVIVRTDIGVPVRDPRKPIDQRWVFTQNKISDLNFNLGIGYPF